MQPYHISNYTQKIQLEIFKYLLKKIFLWSIGYNPKKLEL